MAGTQKSVRQSVSSSIYELANLVDRDLKNVQDDLRLLEKYGVVRMSTRRSRGKREVRVPEALFAQIALKIAI